MTEYRPQELAAVDPDETQFRADTILMHAELVELELYTLRRKWFRDPGLTSIKVGAGQPVEQTIRGFQDDPFNGVAIYNPTPVTLSVGFQAGAGYLAPATVPPFTWARFPQRFVNLSIAVLASADQQAAVATPVSIVRLYAPTAPAAGSLATVPPQPLTSLSAASAVSAGQVLDLGYPRAAHSLIVIAAGAPTAGNVGLQVSDDGVNFAQLAGTPNIVNAGTWTANAGNFPARYVRAAITTAIAGGTVTATVASV